MTLTNLSFAKLTRKCSSVLLLSALGMSSAYAVQTTFSPDGLEVTNTLGQFEVKKDIAFGGGTYTSPLLFDPNTQISHTLTGDPNKINTQITFMDMTDGLGNHVRAGSAAISAPASNGLVTSTNSDGTFPASSSFSVFVNIESAPLTALLGVGAYFYNTTGMIISNPAITELPPTVVYIHEASSPTDIFIYDPLTSNDGGALNGVRFGSLTLAGHGVFPVQYTDGSDGQKHPVQTLGEFAVACPGCMTVWNDQNPVTNVPEPEQWLMLMLGLPLLSIAYKRKA